MKGFVTKYCLTEGIQEAELHDTTSPDMKVVHDGKCTSHLHGEGKDWHFTRDAAVIRANRVKFKKIESLKKSIAKPEALKFE